MYRECIVIIGVFMLMEVVFLRSHHKEWALAMIPLGIVPLTNVVLELVVEKLFKTEVSEFAGVLVITVAVAVEALSLGLCSGLIESKRSKASYIAISNVFNIALALILIHHIIFLAQ